MTTILLAGGGTGGHIFPGVAVLERLRDKGFAGEAHFLVSQRQVDRQIVEHESLSNLHVTGSSALPVRPLTFVPWKLPGFLVAWRRSIRQTNELIARVHAAAVVATGGFVSGPAVVAASRAGLPVALVNLDAVPGRANRAMARRATQLFSVYDTPHLPGAQRVGLPLRRSAVGPDDPRQARVDLGLDPDRDTLLVTGGSQGARSINKLMAALASQPAVRAALADWQVLHLCGAGDEGELPGVYQQAGVPAKVQPFCDAMGLAWRAATVAISRSGAGSVAEVWANATPTIFLPYPYHRDEHQRLNAQPLVDAGGAVMLRDMIDPQANAGALAPLLVALVTDADRRSAMIAAMRRHEPADGAEQVAAWLMDRLAG